MNDLNNGIDFKWLEGKTVATATVMKKPEYDDTGWVRLTFSDGSECVINGSYSGYTGESEDEYPERLFIFRKCNGLVPVEDAQ